MSVESKIAWRYLLSKKGHSAINIVSGVSAAAVAVVTAAMLCVMSVMNGFESLVENMFSEFDAELRITAAEGKYFSTADPAIQALYTMEYVETVSEQVIETALIQYREHRMPATLMGVDSAFQSLTHIDSILTDGQYSVYDGAFERTVMGRGLAIALGVNAHFVGGIHIYAPRRTQRVNMLRPDESFNEGTVFMAGTFAVNQLEYDDHVMLVSTELARSLFEYRADEVTALGIKTRGNIRDAQKQIQTLVGTDYIVANRYEQQADFYRIVRVEKLLTVLLMVFILLIASFNIISSLSMLILDKKESIAILSSIGASKAQIQRIFLYEGWMISSIGAGLGLIIGLGLCVSQEQWGWLTLGNGTEYVISAYPVVVQAADVLLVTVIVLSLGWIAAFVPSRKI